MNDGPHLPLKSHKSYALQRLILDVLMDEPDGLTARKIASTVGITIEQANDHLTKLVGRGRLESERFASDRATRYRFVI